MSINFGQHYVLIGTQIEGVTHGVFIDYFDYKTFYKEVEATKMDTDIVLSLESELENIDREIKYGVISSIALKVGITQGSIMPVHSLRAGLTLRNNQETLTTSRTEVNKTCNNLILAFRLYIDRAYVALYSEHELDITRHVERIKGLILSHNKKTNRDLRKERAVNILERIVISRFDYDQLEAQAHNTKANFHILEEIAGRKLGNRRVKKFVKGLVNLLLTMQTTNRWTYSDENESILFVRQVELHNMVRKLLDKMEGELFFDYLTSNYDYYVSDDGEEFGSLTILKERQNGLLDSFEYILRYISTVIMSLENPNDCDDEEQGLDFLKEKFRVLHAQENVVVTPVSLRESHDSLWTSLKKMRGEV